MKTTKLKERGSLTKALRRANRHRGHDRVTFRKGIGDRIDVDWLRVEDGVTIAGPGPELVGDRNGGTLYAATDDPRGRLTLRRMRLRAIEVTSSYPLTLDQTELIGEGIGPYWSGVYAYRADESKVVDSKISGWAGTGVAFVRSDRIEVTDSQFADNGYSGLYLDGSDAEVDGSLVAGNGAGGIGIAGGSEVGITETAVTGNESSGGIAVSGKAGLALSRSTVSGNSGWRGGGIDVDQYAAAEVRNSTVSGNTSTGGGRYSLSYPSRGGGIYSGLYGNLDIAATTITGNDAETGAGVYFGDYGAGDGVPSVRSSIIAGNAAGGEDCAFADGVSVASKGGNVFGPAGCGPARPSDLLAADPRLAPLAENGGPTRTHALLPGSPAIGNGLDLGLTTDQRGVPRDGNPDSGSYEVGR